jgi:hypothetical protein
MMTGGGFFNVRGEAMGNGPMGMRAGDFSYSLSPITQRLSYMEFL